jgi:hypothetical protein
MRSSKRYNNMKHEIRSAKYETISKFEFRNSSLSRISNFGFRVFIVSVCLISLATPFVHAQNDFPSEDITNSNFSLVVCDGPDMSKARGSNPKIQQYDAKGNPSGERNYVVCDFRAAMKEVQHLINIMIIIGVIASVAGFCYAGFQLIVNGSNPTARTEASGVFKKVFFGFIIMLTAWFIVYQILAWLQCAPNEPKCKSPASALLGSPTSK